MYSHRLRLFPYSGGHIDFIEGELKDCRWRASRLIRKHRNEFEYPVTILEPHRKWELESDPEGAHMISDCEGVLVIQELEPEPEDEDEDEDDFDEFDDPHAECEDCGDEVPICEMTDGLCHACWDNLDEEDESDEEA